MMKYQIYILFFVFVSLLMKAESNTDKRLLAKADSAFAYCKKHKLDTSFCLLVDMKIHPGKYRMFVWSFSKKGVIKSSLCCHGLGKGSTISLPVFSNINGSYCTSLGKYKTGKRSYSQYGINVHYKLYGLEKSNSNAFKRVIVLHSYTPVSETEIYPSCPPLGWSLGCPVIDNQTMRLLDEKLQVTKKPVLLWIYY